MALDDFYTKGSSYLPCCLQVLGHTRRKDDLAQAESRKENLAVPVHRSRDEHWGVSHAKHASFISTKRGESNSPRVKVNTLMSLTISMQTTTGGWLRCEATSDYSASRIDGINGLICLKNLNKENLHNLKRQCLKRPKCIYSTLNFPLGFRDYE